MNEITIKKGWKNQIFDIAKSIIVECGCCKKDINLKAEIKSNDDRNRFGALRQPFLNDEELTFLCKDCFAEVQTVVERLMKRRKK